MKGFLKFIVSIFAVFGAVIGALAIFDKFSNKNRIKGDYLECNVEETEDENEEFLHANQGLFTQNQPFFQRKLPVNYHK